ncbi:hypothetical protein M409DRAFT_69218 [Zasmidium cellare ATCC 36951]|uniref:Zn(2)-C6 fungal-type domain-containing protein n=1 Tax=Zasmidium cellare ATCC 36951 TaxID=1080233 RepID=A0A6A6CA48_ZASCE|nr:uncharacterized protein M409DRAFT_69218 [Zasmidium cellare ATCC 36951]KAF2162326.1 hypothetical protein M409DRAFT_69218 [Zasmidium cellare ATCC 36951]
MDQQLPLSSASAYTTSPSLGSGDTACNECKRRKGRCDRVLPECGPCARNKRHCLYERNAKTPLTRKHLTAVEERLRIAEGRCREWEGRARVAEGKLGEYVGLPWAPQTAEHDSRDYRLEEPPSNADDFSWDEQSAASDSEHRQSLGVDDAEESNVTDGMASLSVEDRGTGYLGVASGAAMLRLLLPDAQHRRHLRTRSSVPRADPIVPQEDGWVPTSLFAERNIGNIDLDGAINSYFRCFHVAYPVVHEPTFRAQYAQVIPRPNGRTWNALAYMVGAVGLFTTSKGPSSQDVDLFEAAKSNISIGSLESGNITLVQVLALMSNYLQKRNKPNSGYNYLGLALHVAMGLGLHKEFNGWQIAPLAMEIRRRVWWTLFDFFSGATVTFGRPLSWPSHGIEVALPLNIDDRDLTHASATLPPAKAGLTTHSGVSVQARFHLATNDIYAKVIALDFPSAQELLKLDDERLEPWKAQWYNDSIEVPERLILSRNLTAWRCSNFRIIMYRPFLIKHVFRLRNGVQSTTLDTATQSAIDRCLNEAAWSTASIHDFWMTKERHIMSAWYCLYFIFQASLIPVIMLRNDPMSERSVQWRQQIKAVLQVTESMRSINPASKDCHTVILRLCGDYLLQSQDGLGAIPADLLQPVEESPQTQLSSVYSMMWPNANTADFDTLITDDSWMEFITDFPTETPLVPDAQFTDAG